MTLWKYQYQINIYKNLKEKVFNTEKSDLITENLYIHNNTCLPSFRNAHSTQSWPWEKHDTGLVRPTVVELRKIFTQMKI